jgi:cobalt-zinc-cadmium efflux system membrane fusion protein
MLIRIAAVMAFVGALALSPSLAHEGHDHGAEAPAAVTSVGPRLVATSDAFELVGVPRDGALILWLDRRDSNEPVTTASIDVETPSGPQTAKPLPDGVYSLAAPWAVTAKRTELTFTITDGAAIDILSGALVSPLPAAGNTTAAPSVGGNIAGLAGILGLALGTAVALTLRRRPTVLAGTLAAIALVGFGSLRLFAHEGHDHDDAKTLAPVLGERPQIVPGGAVFLPKASQRLLDARTITAQAGKFARALELPGRIIPDPNASGLVQASTTGRLQPPQGGFPLLGAKVKAGDILAYVAIPFLAIDRSTMRQQQGDLDQQISIVERRLTRYETLVKSNAVAKVTLDETRLELQGLRDKRAALDKVKREPEALRAPVDGIIAAANATAGQIADPGTVVFQIVDPARLLVEALSFERVSASRASARLADGRGLPLAFLGAGFADRNQAVPLDFRVSGPTEGLRLGQFVTVSAETDETVAGIALPRASIVRRPNGDSVVYLHITPETFEALPVRTEPLDAERVRVVQGLKAGARVVTQAAELINQIR